MVYPFEYLIFNTIHIVEKLKTYDLNGGEQNDQGLRSDDFGEIPNGKLLEDLNLQKFLILKIC